jgi:hypothetical protein
MVWDASQSTAATKTKAYLNGSLLTNTSSTSFTSIINRDKLLDVSGYLKPFDGEIGQLSIFDYAISQNQVNYLYNSGAPQNPMAISGQPPVAYYPLGGSSTGSASTLTVPNESVPSATVFESDPGFFDLPGSSLAPILSGISNFTLSLWYKQDAVSNRFLFDIKDGTNRMALQLVNASTNYFYFNSAFNAYSAVDTPINQWNNVVFVFDGSEANVDRIKLYVNGSRITASITGAIDATLGTFGASTLANLAAASTGGSLYALNGEITNTQIWTISLGATDITTLYNNGVPLLTGTQPQAANLKAWWKMNVDNANWLGSDWQIAEATSAYPQSFDFVPNDTITTPNPFSSIVTGSNVIGTCTISYWLKVAGGSQQSFMELVNSATHTAGFRIDSNNKPYYINSQGGRYKRFAALSNPSDWNHWCWIFPSDTSYTDAKLYINGVEQSVDFDYSAAPANTAWNGFYINKFQTSSSATFKMSNLQLWSGNLTEPQITELYNNGSPLTTAIASSNLKAWYKLDNTETYLKPPPSQTQNLYEAWLSITNTKFI